MDLKKIKLTCIKQVLERKGYKIFTGKMNMNIIMIRSNDRNVDTFNDAVVLFWENNNGLWEYFITDATVDPSGHYLLNFMNKQGAAIVLPGQYKGILRLGYHKGYRALVQAKEIEVLRDFDKDATIHELAYLTKEQIETYYKIYIAGNISYIHNNENDIIAKLHKGMFGINFHRASMYRVLRLIGLYGAGCTVTPDIKKFSKMLSVIESSARLYGDTFTATYITENDIDKVLDNE